MNNKFNLKSGTIIKTKVTDKTANIDHANYLLSIDEEYKYFYLVDLETFYVFPFDRETDADITDEMLDFLKDNDEELISFNDYVIPNEALSQGDIDANAFQHKPYLDEQSKQRGYKLAIIGKTFIYPIAAYSKKIKSLADLKDESTIIIPNDPTNGGRSLLLLEKNGLLKLKPGTGLLPKVTDIVSNPKKLKILELEAPQLPRALDDANVTIAIINNTFASQAGLVPSRDALFVEDKDSPYVNLVVSREDNKNEEKVKQFLQAFQSAEVEQEALKEFKGGAVKGW